MSRQRPDKTTCQVFLTCDWYFMRIWSVKSSDLWNEVLMISSHILTRVFFLRGLHTWLMHLFIASWSWFHKPAAIAVCLQQDSFRVTDLIISVLCLPTCAVTPERSSPLYEGVIAHLVVIHYQSSCSFSSWSKVAAALDFAVWAQPELMTRRASDVDMKAGSVLVWGGHGVDMAKVTYYASLNRLR